jgi:hypothetical protein
MSNLFTALPVPAGNGVGTAVDVSAYGGTKTVIVVGTAASTINVEFNNAADPDDGSWQSIVTVQGSGSTTTAVAARWMRVRVSNFTGGTSDVHVGATDAGALFAALDVPAGNGNGSSISVSSLTGLFKTVQVGGKFKGVLLVEVSVDGDEWAQPFSFSQPGAQSMTVVANLMRVRRTGIIGTDVGTPVVNVGATTLGEGGGGSSSSTLQAFTYTVTGSEPDLSELEITLPVPIASQYGVTASCQGVATVVTFDFPQNLMSSTTFTAIASTDLTANDVICFFVAPLTSGPT